MRPVIQQVRPLPFSLRSKVENKLKELLREDVIEQVDGPTLWVSPIVVVPKPSGDIRICVDMRIPNTAVLPEKHVIPTVDEVILDLNQSSYFSRIDVKMAYHQLEIEEASRPITAFATHMGVFRYKRLLFGLKSASEHYQKTIQQILQGCEGVKNISDDLIIHGSNIKQHDERLFAVLDKLKQSGLTLNKEKCQFRLNKLVFMGHVLSDKGVSITEERSKALMEARRPESVSEVRSFMGLVNFCGRFINDLVSIAEPLTRLTRKDIPFKWGNDQEKAFNKLKDTLSSPKTLAYFDGNAQTKVIADAGPVGLGGILVQEQNGEQHVICYASRSLTDVERRYSQTEKEALTLVWACERFHLYLYGRKKKGKANVSDCLSRLITDNSKNSEISDFNERYINFVTKTAVPVAMTAAEIEAESEKDQEITNLRVCIRSSDWGRCKYPKYVFAKDELCEFNNTVLRGTRIVVPYKLRQRVIQLAHEGHQGIVKTKQRLRTKVWWPSMEKDVEKFCRLCRECQRVGLPDPPEEMRRTELPKGPWQDLAADLMGPLPNGEYVLVIVDYFSRYFEVNFIRRVTSTVIVRCLEKMFTTHGLPYSIKTDNGRQFVSEELETFLEEHGIEHRTSTPYWPQANGEVERQNRTLLKTLKIAHAQKLNIHHELNKFLIAYRSTPHCITGETPAKLLFGREIRTKLPDIQATTSNIEDVRDRDYQLKLKGKVYADAKRQAKQSNINKGDFVILKQDRENKLSETFSTNQYKVIEKKATN